MSPSSSKTDTQADFTMPNITALLAFLLLPLSIGWGASAVANSNRAEAVPQDPLATLPACEIRVDESGNTIVLEGIVFADADLSGSYHMQIRQKGLGSSRISQSGDFQVRAGAPGSLGMVSLAKGAGSYFATLSVRWHDGAADCVAQAPESRKVKFLDKKSALPRASDSPQGAPAPLAPVDPAPK
jgi:curli production assembly/transport CsgH protein